LKPSSTSRKAEEHDVTFGESYPHDAIRRGGRGVEGGAGDGGAAAPGRTLHRHGTHADSNLSAPPGSRLFLVVVVMTRAGGEALAKAREVARGKAPGPSRFLMRYDRLPLSSGMHRRRPLPPSLTVFSGRRPSRRVAEFQSQLLNLPPHDALSYPLASESVEGARPRSASRSLSLSRLRARIHPAPCHYSAQRQ
jgi:hypothetical protein